MSTLAMNSFLRTPDDKFKKYVAWSLAAHFALVFFFATKAVFFSDEAINYEAAVKVDLVALPDKALPNEIAPIAELEKKAEMQVLPKKSEKVKDPDAINLDKTKKREKAALTKLKQLSALEDIEKEVSEETKKKAMDKLRKGNAISAGTELKGLNKLQHDNYIASVERQIRQNWSLPEWLARKNLSAQVRVRFDQSGNIISHDIVKSSGNASYDEIVLGAVQKSSPVPAPPAKFVRILISEGILIGFPE